MTDRTRGSSQPGGRAKVCSLPNEDRRPHIKKNGAKFPAIKIFCVPEDGAATGAADLFGEPRTATKEFTRPCAECGDEFSQAQRQGRPLRFCSVDCREISKNRQKRRWEAANHSPRSLLTCRRCGREFQPPPRTAGRAPHWCSPACKRAEFRRQDPEPSGQDLLDFTRASTPKGKSK